MRFPPPSCQIRANFEMLSFDPCSSLFSGPKGLEKLARNSSISKMSIMPIEIICCPPPPERIFIQRDLDAKIGNEKDAKLAIRVEALKPKKFRIGGLL